jgi:PKD repeat protein
MKKRVLTLVASILLAGILCFTSSCKKHPPQACISDLQPQVLAGTAIDFKSCSNGASGYEWDFGDGTKANTPITTHKYTTGGYYTCKLTVSNSDGNSMDTFGITVIASAPDACINNVPSTAYTNQVIDFETCPSLTATYLWNFGDGNTSTAESPNHYYSSPGIYTITLTATNPFGHTTKTQTITITQAYTATKADYIGNFFFTDACIGSQPSYIENVSALGGDTIAIKNFGGYGQNVVIKAIVNGAYLNIPNQNGAGNLQSVSGSGSISSDHQTLNITHNDQLLNGSSNNCTGSGAKQ